MAATAKTRLSSSFREASNENSAARKASNARKKRHQSFAHCDFANPHAETCWLSCLFQTLWHSVIFHRVFEQHLTAEKYSPSRDERILAALQRTWAEYQALEDKDVETHHVEKVVKQDGDCMVDDRLVAPANLSAGFGEGYGDMSEAMAQVQSELSESGNVEAIQMADLLAIVPISFDDHVDDADEDAWPTPKRAWKQAAEWHLTARPIVAIDIAAPELLPEECGELARLWIPVVDQNAASTCQLGQQHRLVAICCFMWNYSHYVVFCQRQSDTTKCIFFNDLPTVTPEAPREVEWKDVPALCEKYCLAARFALYESVPGAAAVVNAAEAAVDGNFSAVAAVISSC